MQVYESGYPPKIYTRPLHVPSGFLANVPEFKQGFLAELRLLCYCVRMQYKYR